MNLHNEEHFLGQDLLKDIVIGMSDGLTVPFALAAGLSGAVSSTSIIVIAGLAEIAAGCVAMGLGGFLAGKTEAEHYQAELAREYREIKELPDMERREVDEIIDNMGLKSNDKSAIVEAIISDEKRWVDFMMRFELGLEEPDERRAYKSAITIGLSYVVGGLVPLVPYMFIGGVSNALIASIVCTSIALFIFGFIKGHFTGISKLRSAASTFLIGAIAAATAFVIAKVVQ